MLLSLLWLELLLKLGVQSLLTRRPCSHPRIRQQALQRVERVHTASSTATPEPTRRQTQSGKVELSG
jgi:hypothetical protein